METKICSKCKQKKSLSAFSKDCKGKSGLQSYCKICKARHDRQYYQSHKINIVEQQKGYSQTSAGKESHKRGNKNYHKKFPKKKKAGCVISNAIRRGRMKASVFCESCGLPAKTEGHHPDYNKPFDVEWLCTPCHVKLRQSNK